MTNYDLAFQAANTNWNYFGYLAIMAAAAMWLAYNHAPGLINRLKLPSIPTGLWVFLGALALRCVALGAESLWYDEAFTAVIARLPLNRMIAATAHDVHPPAFYILEWFTIRLIGDSEFALRLLPALFSAGASVLVYQITRQALPPAGRFDAHRIALWAGLGGLIMPGLHYYGQEARAYSMLAFLMLLALWAMQRRRWVVYGAAVALGLYTHNYAALYAFALLVAGLFRSDRAEPQIVATALGGIVYTPWLPVLWGQVRAVEAGYWIPALTPGRAISEPFLTVIIGFRAPQLLTLVALSVVFVLLAAGFVSLFRLESILGAETLLIFTFLPPILAAVASVAVAPIYLPRGMIPSAYTALIPAAAFLAYRRELRITVLALFVVLMAFAFTSDQNRRADIRGPVEDLQLTTGQTIYHTDEQSYILLRYYAPQVDNVLADLPAGLDHGLSPGTRAALGIPQAVEPGGDYIVIADGSGRPQAQHDLIASIQPGQLLAVLFENSTQRGAIYEYRASTH